MQERKSFEERTKLRTMVQDQKGLNVGASTRKKQIKPHKIQLMFQPYANYELNGEKSTISGTYA